MESDFTHLSVHLAVLRRQWWVLLVLLALGAVVGVVLTPLKSQDYTADAQVLVPSDLASQSVTTQVAIVTSDVVVDDVIYTLGLDASSRDLREMVSAEAVEATNVIDINATQGTRYEAALVANAFAESYLKVVDGQLDQVKASEDQVFNQQIRLTTKKILTLQARLPRLTGGYLARAQASIGTLQRRGQQIDTERLNRKLTEQGDSKFTRGEVILHAVTPPAISRPWLRGLLLGGLLGLIVGAVIAYTRDRRDDTVRGEAELVRLVTAGTPVLGRIPAERSRQRGGVTVLSDASSVNSEAYRTLATNLQFLITGRPLAVEAGQHTTGEASLVVVCADSAGSGTTTVASNVAVMAARMGLRVTLVDANLRDPGVATRFGLTAGQGLTDALSSTVTASALLNDTDVENLRVLRAGSGSVNPTELITSLSARHVWRDLQRDADLVIIDTAPLLTVADTLGLTAVADQVVLVVRQSRSKADQVSSAIGRLELAGGSLSGVVLNGVRGAQVNGVGHRPDRESDLERPAAASWPDAV